jgi:small subunit ribosomal protein S1
VRAKDQAEQNDAIQKIQSEGSSASSGTTNLGALLKAKLKNPS